MWPLALLVLSVVGVHAGGRTLPWVGDDDDDFNNYHSKEASNSATDTSTPSQATGYTRVRRYDQTTPPVRTLSPEEIREVRGVLGQVMAGQDLSKYTPDSVSDLRRLVDLLKSPSPNIITDLTHFTQSTMPNIPDVPVMEDDKDKKSVRDEGVMKIRNDTRRKTKYLNKKYETHFGHYWWVQDDVLLEEENTDFHQIFPLAKLFASKDMITNKCLEACLKLPGCLATSISVPSGQCSLHRTSYSSSEGARFESWSKYKYYQLWGRITTSTATPTTVNTTEAPTTPPLIIDIKKLVAIIANLTMNTIESNLTELFNATLHKYGLPYCEEPSTTTEEPIIYDFVNASVISKCFVCGLEDYGIPRNAYCADAFAGDFLPLVPVDPRAKGQIARYRKYCRYLDVPGMLVNETQPRSVFGRWTGGCSVRWIDLSGVYTQRACRNRRHATMGRHYVSKRMAKLEMALKNEDQGCVISPMSSLVPLSRGISLYARFHACVCTGSWCNSTPAARTSRKSLIVFVVLVITIMIV